MTPSSPDEALHFRGKTLTPESPRPLHVAEPANIPVLQNQMDPIFNDTSTYERSDRIQENTEAHNERLSHRLYGGSGNMREDMGPVQGQETDPAALLAQALPEDSSHAPPINLASSVPLPQNIPEGNEINTAGAQPAPHDRLEAQKAQDNEHNSGEEGVDFQNLLDNLPPPSSTAPSASAITETVSSTADDLSVPQATSDESLQTPLGLPPRPPPQEKPSIHPNYTPSDDIRAYHQLPPHSSNAPASYQAQQSSYPSNLGLPPMAAAGAPGTASGASALPPPPVASFQQTPPSAAETQEPPTQATQKNGRVERPIGRQSRPGDDDAPWGPEVQKKYDEFLHDERVYVTEGLWDRFPPGSRLFVGNLPTERVTKRDLFHIFHKFGKLAQISIKQAYGFIQFLDSTACYQALQTEQGAVVRGRKIHLEISKPQRNTRPGPPPADSPRAPQRRSRSPEYGRSGPNPRNPRAQGDRHDRSYEPGRVPFSDFRDEPSHRRRDDYRPPRSPSPRGFRGRDGYRSRDRTPERYDRRDRRRSRSPYGRDRRYRTPSPRARSGYDSDSDLPVPRRAPRDVPDAQILVLEEVDRNFIFHVETAFRNRGLRVDVLMLGPRIPLPAAVHRQVIEGVIALVKLSRSNQYSGKITLQILDRTGGPDNVRFTDYPDLDLNVATEVVFQAQSMQRGGAPVPYPPNPAFGVPPIPPAQAPQPSLPALPNPPNIANLISSLDGPTLQSLLGALQQRPNPLQAPQPPFAAANGAPSTDLASLLNHATRQPNPIQPIQPNQQPPLHPQPLPLQIPNAPVVTDPNLLSLLAKGLGGQQPQGQAAVSPNIQNIMNQLAKWKQ